MNTDAILSISRPEKRADSANADTAGGSENTGGAAFSLDHDGINDAAADPVQTLPVPASPTQLRDGLKAGNLVVVSPDGIANATEPVATDGRSEQTIPAHTLVVALAPPNPGAATSDVPSPATIGAELSTPGAGVGTSSRPEPRQKSAGSVSQGTAPTVIAPTGGDRAARAALAPEAQEQTSDKAMPPEPRRSPTGPGTPPTGDNNRRAQKTETAHTTDQPRIRAVNADTPSSAPQKSVATVPEPLPQAAKRSSETPAVELAKPAHDARPSAPIRADIGSERTLGDQRPPVPTDPDLTNARAVIRDVVRADSARARAPAHNHRTIPATQSTPAPVPAATHGQVLQFKIPPVIAAPDLEASLLSGEFATSDPALAEVQSPGARSGETRVHAPIHLYHGGRIVAAVAEAARHLSFERPVEISLHPEELGRVKMSLSGIDGAMNVAITVERPETLELMRRHIDMLASQLRDIGYKDVTFSFAGHGQSGAHDDNDPPGNPVRAGALPDRAGADFGEAHPQPRVSLHLAQGGRMDIRL